MTGTTKKQQEDTNHLVTVELDEKTLSNPSPDIEHERRVAIFDLLENNTFAVVDDSKQHAAGPFHLRLSIEEGRLIFDIANGKEHRCAVFGLSVKPFRRIVKDYFMVCESYFEAIRTATPSQIEAIDMGRRGLHNDGSVLLQERLKGKIETDFETARRLFTLVCVLHWRGQAELAGPLPSAVLFACTQNAVRSPMASGLMRHFYGHKVFVTSAGVIPQDLDPFAVAALEEIGIDISAHEPRSFDELHDSLFDIIISLSPEAQHKAVELTRTMAVDLEYWPTLDPTLISGSREQMMDAYRGVRDGLLERMRKRFGKFTAPVV